LKRLKTLGELIRHFDKEPATFEAIAIPRRYNQTGKRSFYIATPGVIYGADKNGAPATDGAAKLFNYPEKGEPP
jgi:hypothetical protein